MMAEPTSCDSPGRARNVTREPTESLRQLAAIIAGNLCHRCGTCSAICPHDVLRPDDDAYPSWEGREDKCIDCSLCVRVCPGREFSYPEHSRKLFGREPDITERCGFFLKAWIGHTNDTALLARTTSGGIATEIPRFLLKEGRIKAAVAVRSDPRLPWKPAAFVARSPEEIVLGAYSKYPACSLNHVLRLLDEASGPWLVTGLPCHIHGIRKLCSLKKDLEHKIALVVGLFCHSCLDHQALRDMIRMYRLPQESIAEVVYRRGKLPGEVHARLRDGSWIGLPYPFAPIGSYRPNAKEFLTFFFKFYSPLRCRMCIDASSEFSDISLSDPWVAGWQAVSSLEQGRSFILGRTERGCSLLEEMAERKIITLESFPYEQARKAHGPMARDKRRRAWHTMNQRRKRNEPAPDYGVQPALDSGERRAACIHTATYFAADRPVLRRFIMRILLSRPGRWIVYAMLFRRRVLVAALEKWRAARSTRQSQD